MAPIAGASTQFALELRTVERKTSGKSGHAASIKALMPIQTTAMPAALRSERTASMIAPPGIRPISPIIR